jgi:bacterioferritin-associated ferredoxin
MYICICKKVTDGQIRRAVWEKGVANVRGLKRELGGACDQCGKCAPDARELIRQCLDDRSMPDAKLLTAAV